MSSLSDRIIALKQAGFSYAEIGELIGYSKDAVRSQYRRAMGTHTKKAPKKIKDTKRINGTETLRVAFPTDEHFPFQDERARSVALQIVQSFNPDVCIAGSDALDFYVVSKYDKDPERVAENDLQSEIDAWQKGQEEWLSAARGAQFVFLPGNHEDRLRRYLWKRPELHSLRNLRMQALLGLDDMGIEYKDELVLFDRLVIKHGDRISKHSAFTAKAELEHEKHSISTMTGHTHRGGSHYVTTRTGVMQAHECFCLCSLEPEYVKKPNWQQGIALATVATDYLHVELIPFHSEVGYTVAYWRDKRYSNE